jgi:hypothetical protein
MRPLAVAGVILWLAGCAAAMPAAPPGPGPNHVLEVTNASGQRRTIGFEYELAGGSGGGEWVMDACRRAAVPLSDVPPGTVVAGYRILVDQGLVADVALPAGVRPGAHVVIRMRIGPTGEVDVDQPVVVAEPPDISATFPAC